MDCKTARLLLEFDRPRAGETDAAETAALEQHLAGCPECDSLARAERGVDRAFARAVQAVEVPAGLRGRLLERLERDRGDVHRRRAGRLVRVAAAAAAVVLIGWAVYAWRQAHLPAVDMDRAWDDLHARHVSPPGVDVLESHFRGLGFEGPFPRDLNYSLLTYYGMGQFEGRQVPQLIFVAPKDVAPRGEAHAEVLVLSSRQFDLASLPATYESPPGYDYKIALWRDPAGRFAEMVDYTGGNADWVRRDRAAEEGAN